MISPLCPIENSDLSQMKESLHSRHQIMITVPIECYYIWSKMVDLKNDISLKCKVEIIFI